MLKVKTTKELIEKCKENEVKFFDFRFTDIKGTCHHLTYHADSIDENKFKALTLDASSIPAWQPITQSDVLLIPDPETAFLDPFTIDPTVIIFCDIYDIYKKQPYEKCPRSIAKKAMDSLKKTGIADTAYFKAENEFFIFDNILVKDDTNCQYYKVDSIEGQWNSDAQFENQPNTGHRPVIKGGYFPTPPVDTQHEIRVEISKTLNRIGLKTDAIHHELGQAQGKISVKFANLLEAADNVQKYKYVVKMVAHKFGKTATFMPKPLCGENGNGMHIQQSIWKDGSNLFSGENDQKLSNLALRYIQGVFYHAGSVAAFTNPSSNSYKRLSDIEAPKFLNYSAQNRSVSCRAPFIDSKDSSQVEFRFPDSSSNPYLAFSSILMAGIYGIKNKIDPAKPIEINLFDQDPTELNSMGIQQIPHTLRSSIESMMSENEYLKENDVFTQDFLNAYQNYKLETEVYPIENRPHPFEFISTYSC